MSNGDLLTQLTSAIGDIQQGQRQWEHGKYSGASPRFEQELTNLTTKWTSIFNYLDVQDTASVNNAYKELEQDFSDYNRMYPQELFKADLIKKDITEMLDEYKNRASFVEQSNIALSNYNEQLRGYVDSDIVGTMFQEYMKGNPDKTQKDFREKLAIDIAGTQKNIKGIYNNLFFLTEAEVGQNLSETQGQGLHKLRQNPFFNNNLLAVDGFDDIYTSLKSSNSYINLLKDEFDLGLDGVVLVDSFDPYIEANQKNMSEGNAPYELKWHINPREADQLKKVLNGVIDSTDYKTNEALVMQQRDNNKTAAFNRQKSNISIYENIKRIKSIAEQNNKEGLSWDKIPMEAQVNIFTSKNEPYTYGQLKTDFTRDILGGNWESLPSEMRTALEAAAKISGDGAPIVFDKDFVTSWEQQNKQAIQKEDLTFLQNWNDIEGEYPVPMEVNNPGIYPKDLIEILNGDDESWSRRSPKYNEFSTIDYNDMRYGTGLINADDIDAENDSRIINQEVESFDFTDYGVGETFEGDEERERLELEIRDAEEEERNRLLKISEEEENARKLEKIKIETDKINAQLNFQNEKINNLFLQEFDSRNRTYFAKALGLEPKKLNWSSPEFQEFLQFYIQYKGHKSELEEIKKVLVGGDPAKWLAAFLGRTPGAKTDANKELQKIYKIRQKQVQVFEKKYRFDYFHRTELNALDSFINSKEFLEVQNNINLLEDKKNKLQN